ncbi:hypothetical protein MKW92_044571, partial [Papaver armeniacum]
MAPPDLERSAKEAFVDDNFELAIDLYTQAITLDPSNPDLFADRAQANIKLENFTEAVADSNRAIVLDPTMAKAYLAKEEAAQLSKQFGQNVPPTNVPAPVASSSSQVAPVIVLDAEPEAVAPPPPKYRHGYYQKPEEVVVTIFAKHPGQDEFVFQPRLFGSKIEMRLAKAEAINWTSLEYTRENTVQQKLNAPSATESRPSYPSSKSKLRPVDWDKLEAQVKKELESKRDRSVYKLEKKWVPRRWKQVPQL